MDTWLFEAEELRTAAIREKLAAAWAKYHSNEPMPPGSLRKVGSLLGR